LYVRYKTLNFTLCSNIRGQCCCHSSHVQFS
jgi:hypothetical protein